MVEVDQQQPIQSQFELTERVCLPQGSTIGAFIVNRQLGEGGTFGMVYSVYGEDEVERYIKVLRHYNEDTV